MNLSVLVTNYKTPEMLKLCLKSLKEALFNFESYEVFVLDAESGQDTQFVVKEHFPEFKLTPFKKNIGFRALVNEGLKISEGGYVLILNSDIIFTKGSIEKMIGYMQANQSIGILGPQLLNFDGSVQESCFRFFGPLTALARRTFFGKTSWGKKLMDKFLMKDFNHQEIRDVDWIMGSAILVRRDAIGEVGPMDERFFMYFEDVDWCRRFWEKGFRVVYYPEARIYHYHLRVSKKYGGMLDIFLNRYLWIHIVSAVKYYLKYKGTLAPGIRSKINAN
ncbi:MAG: glycosyltransferase family 2 protein [Candidatus Portnoybacteria bacterium]|nr:glycosyltransferase family 2 protein [Candidatus Portnoybacteria bacterium]